MFFSRHYVNNCLLKTGVYVGNGIDNRTIAIGVNLASKSYVYIIIKRTTGFLAIHRIEYGQGDISMFFTQIADSDNLIQALTDTGFQLGTSTKINENGGSYRYIVFWAD